MFYKKINLIFSLFVVNTMAVSFVNSISMTNSESVTLQKRVNSTYKNIAQIEFSINGRIGVYAMNTANNTVVQYRAEERFPFCSTSKVMVVAAILNKSMTESELLQKHITYSMKELKASGYAPISLKHINTGMSIGELCSAALKYTDDMAMNLLINELGGPRAVTKYARSIGDDSFRLDRTEPKLNSAIPNDSRDTTTPIAMAKSLQRLVLGNALATPQRDLLQKWLKNNTTGNARIRAGVPKGWIVGDKTGTGKYGTTNDIAVIWPPKNKPIIIVVYVTQYNKKASAHNEVIAKVTRLVVNDFNFN